MTALALRQTPLLLCVLLACTPHPEPTTGPSPDTPRRGALGLSTADWAQTTMNKARDQHTATQLLDGRILVVGGVDQTAGCQVIDSTFAAELYNPATHEWSTAASMKMYRFGHTATLLNNGKVLVVGGLGGFGTLDQVELYDPALNTWTQARPLTSPRVFHTATLLADGRVLVVGGANVTFEGLFFSTTAEVYDPESGTWSSTGEMNDTRAFHSTARLPDGKVLVVGGVSDTDGDVDLVVKRYKNCDLLKTFRIRFLGSAEIYDPARNTWTASKSLLNQPRAAHSLTLMSKDKVLVAGGFTQTGNNPITVQLQGMQIQEATPLSSAELSDSTMDGWSYTCAMGEGRAFHTTTLLPDGKLFVTGGIPERSSTELYDLHRTSGACTWSAGRPLPASRSLHTASLLPGGRVLLAGGYHEGSEVLGSALISTPTDIRWSPVDVGAGQVPRRQATLTLLPNQKLLVTGGYDAEGRVLDSTALYDLDKGTWTQGSALKVARRAHTATLLLDRKVLVAGGYDTEGNALKSVEIHDPEYGSTLTTNLAEARGEHTATLLPNGDVLLSGGLRRRGLEFPPPVSDELYDARGQTWSNIAAAFLGEVHACHTATPLPDGRLLIAGGTKGAAPSNLAVVYEPWLRKESAIDSMLGIRECHTATLLPNGKVLVVGGFGEAGNALASAELYDPTVGNGGWTKTATNMARARGAHTATLLPSGQVLVAGGYTTQKGQTALDDFEVYDPTTDTWLSSMNLPLNTARGQHAAALLPDGRLLLVGGNKDGTDFAEAYQPSGMDSDSAPRLADMSPTPLEPGTALTLRGARFQGLFEASGGTGMASAADIPLLTLRSLESGRWVPLATRAFADTSASVTLPDALPVGPYVLGVSTRARTSGAVIVIRDTQSPDTPALDSAPSAVTQKTHAFFSYTSKAVDFQAFECLLDDEPFSRCTGSWSRSDLSDGPHGFAVRALDKAGNSGTPTQYTWRVDTQAPDVSLLSSPEKQLRDTSASFSFSSSANDVDAFECRLGDAEFAPCTNPITYERMEFGPHTFQVRARDKAGNRSLEPATYSWTIMRGYYGLGCGAGEAAPGLTGSWVLLLFGWLKQRRARGTPPA